MTDSIDNVKKDKRYNNLHAARYEYTNERIKPEWIADDEVLWFVNGPQGRRPVFVKESSDDEDTALYEYWKRYQKGPVENES